MDMSEYCISFSDCDVCAHCIMCKFKDEVNKRLTKYKKDELIQHRCRYYTNNSIQRH